MKKEDLKIKINLTPVQKESLTNAVYKWVINVGKIIIIVVQIVAMSALIYRFMLDRQLTDLQDEIKWKEELLIKQEKNEQKYRNLQKRIAEIKLADSNARYSTDTFKQILEKINNNSNLTIKRYSMESNSFTIEADTYSILEISRITNNLKEIKNIDSISIGNMTKEDMSINFTLNIKTEEKYPEINTEKEGGENKNF